MQHLRPGNSGGHGWVTFAAIGAVLAGSATLVRAHESAGHAGHSATLMQDGAILIAGGRDDAGVPVAEAQRYVIAVGEVHPTGRMARPRDRHAATLLPDGRVLVTGGRDGQGELDSMEIFEPSLGTFLLLPAPMLQARQGHTAVVTEDGRVLIRGGSSGGVPVDTAELFDPADDSVTSADTLDGVTLASVASDQPDYYPGDIVTISGGAWLPGETVTLLFDEEPVQHYPRLLTATADGDGNIVNSEYVVEEHDLGTDFLLTATGGASGMTAQVRFTDSPKVGSVTVGAQAPSPVSAGGSATYTVTVNRGTLQNSGGSFAATLSIEAPGLPVGATASFSPNPVSFTSSQNSRTSTLTIAVANCTSASTSAFSVKAASTSAPTDSASSGPSSPTLAITALNCDDGNACTVDSCVESTGCANPPGNLGTQCRASAGACDVAESCTGSSATCPANGFQSSSTVCRGSAGVCDVGENCTGSAAACPADGFQSASTACRASAGVCDVGESCTGSAAACPADGFQSSSAVCRASAGVCDVSESCTGSAAACPADLKSTAVCRVSSGPDICDDAEVCDGSSDMCPSDDPLDQTAPVLACPADHDVVADATCHGAYSVSATASDNCDATLSPVCDLPSGTLFGANSAATSSCSVTDQAVNTGSCQTEVTLVDHTIPTASCNSASVTTSSLQGLCHAFLEVEPTVSDNCDSSPSFSCGTGSLALEGPGSIHTTCQSKDDSGNESDECTSTFTLTDDTDPTVECNTALVRTSSQGGLCEASLPVAPTGEDNCDATVHFICGKTSLSLADPGSDSTSCISEDDSHNTSDACSATLVLQDDTLPTVSCNSSTVTTSSQGGLCAASLAVNPTGSDNCDESVSLTCGQDSLTLADHGSASTTCASNDDSTNVSAPCTSTLTLLDDTAPTASCNSASVATSAIGDLCHAFLEVQPTVLDNCDPSPAYACDTDSLALDGPGSVSTSCHSTDDAENTSADCTSTFTLTDDTAPTVICPAPQTIECTGNHQAHAEVVAQAADNCASASAGCDPGSGDYALGFHAVSCTAEDGSLNQGTCDTAVTVVDTTKPSIACPASVTVECSGAQQATADSGHASASDVCGGVTVSEPGPGVYTLGSTHVTHTATDDAALSATCTNTITVVDTTKPVVDAGSLGRRTVLGNCSGSAVTFEPPTASDTCQQVTVSCPSLPGNSFGDHSATCTATDGGGNATTVEVAVTVLEPLRVAFGPPLEDDNVSDDIQTDADVRNVFKSGQTIPHKTKFYNCSGVDVTTAVAVTAKLDVTLRDSGNASWVIEIAEAYTGVGGPGGLMALTDGQFHYNLSTNGYLAGTMAGTRFFRSEVRVVYNSSPAIVVGREDATLESR